jgi:hypothetical protein
LATRREFLSTVGSGAFSGEAERSELLASQGTTPMTADMQSPDYVWKTGEVKVPKTVGAYLWLKGQPK